MKDRLLVFIKQKDGAFPRGKGNGGYKGIVALATVKGLCIHSSVLLEHKEPEA